MGKQITGFVAALIIALVGFVGYVAYQDHKVVKALEILTAPIGESNGQTFKAVDVVTVLIDERIKQLQAAQAQAKAQGAQPGK